MREEPVLIGQAVSALVAIGALFSPDLVQAVAAVGGAPAVVGAIGVIYGLIAYFVRRRTIPL